MPVFEQGYRRYAGPVSRRPRALAIAWENVRPRLRWWAWLLLFFLLAWPYLVWAIFVFVAAVVGPEAFGRGILPEPSAVAYERSGPFNPAHVVMLARGVGPQFFWDMLDQASSSSVIFPAILGAGLLASDRRTGALQIYFARPVSRADYLAGKVIALTLFTAFTTILPCTLLWIEAIGFGSFDDFTWRTWIAPLSFTAVSALHALWTAGLVLSLSAVLKRPAVVGILAIFLNMAAEGVGNVLAHTHKEQAWLMVRPSVAIGGTAAPLCGMDQPPWFHPAIGASVAIGIPLLLLWFVWWRVRAVEVVT